jgi:hypothetical protein
LPYLTLQLPGMMPCQNRLGMPLSIAIYNSFYLCNVITIYSQRSRYSDWLRAGRQKGRNLGSVKNFLISKLSTPALGSTLHPMQRSGREADHSHPASAEAKKMWTYVSAPLYAFMA